MRVWLVGLVLLTGLLIGLPGGAAAAPPKDRASAAVSVSVLGADLGRPPAVASARSRPRPSDPKDAVTPATALMIAVGLAMVLVQVWRQQRPVRLVPAAHQPPMPSPLAPAAAAHGTQPVAAAA